jgi:hypothetical protein
MKTRSKIPGVVRQVCGRPRKCPGCNPEDGHLNMDWAITTMIDIFCQIDRCKSKTGKVNETWKALRLAIEEVYLDHEGCACLPSSADSR